MAEKDRIIFGKGVLVRPSLAYIYGTSASDNAANNDVSVILTWADDEWQFSLLAARICSVTARLSATNYEVIAVAIDGRVYVTDGKLEDFEDVDSSPDGPNALRHITSVGLVGDQTVAVGMSRMVYRRTGPRQWQRIDEGIRVPRSSREVAGLKYAAGLSWSSVFAVGFYGEIWHFDGTWHRLDSPTNVKLETIAVIGQDDIFVAGGAGTVLRGGSRRWSLIENDATTDTFWSSVLVGDRLFLATEAGLFTIENDRVVPIDPGLGRIPTTRSLSTVNGHVLSVGSSDILLFDGSSWRRIPTPQD